MFKKGKAASTPVLGQRIAVLTSEGGVEVDPATGALPMTLPAPVANPDWTQPGGSASKSVGQVALGTALGRAFTVQAGRGSSLTARLSSAPIVANGRVYTIDTLGAVRAFDARTGAQMWASQTPSERGSEASLYGGGIAYDNGRVYATNGLGYVAALVNNDLLAADPSLANLRTLAPNVEWMNGVQYYLYRDVPEVHGHVIHIDTEWALTSISQFPFWRSVVPTMLACGHVKDIISVDVSDVDPNVTISPAACQVVPEVSLSRSRTTTSVQPMSAR